MKEWDQASLEYIDIDISALCDAVAAKADTLVFRDSYGDGVVLVDGVSHPTYHALAAAYGLDVMDFRE